MKKILIFIIMGASIIMTQYPNIQSPHIKPPIPSDIDDALITWAIINAATKEQKECNLYIDRYQIATTTFVQDQKIYIYETILDTYIGEVVSRKRVPWDDYEYTRD